MWIARDEDESLWIYDTKPIKGDNEWVIANTTGGCCKIGDGDLDEFDGVKWKDDEPKELILKQ